MSTYEHERYRVMALLKDPELVPYINHPDLSKKKDAVEAVRTVIRLDKLREGMREQAHLEQLPRYVTGGFGNMTVLM